MSIYKVNQLKSDQKILGYIPHHCQSPYVSKQMMGGWSGRGSHPEINKQYNINEDLKKIRYKCMFSLCMILIILKELLYLT